MYQTPKPSCCFGINRNLMFAAQHSSVNGPGVPAVWLTAGVSHGAVFVTYR